MGKTNRKQDVKNNRKNGRLILIVLVFVTLTVFVPILWHEFVAWDDDMLIHQNPFYHPVNLRNLLYFWKHHYEGLYMPLTYNFWAIISLIAKQSVSPDRPSMSPVPFHAANLLLHLINVFLTFSIIFFLIKKIAAPSGKKIIQGMPYELWAAGIGALVFAIHPIQVESVAWATGSKELLSTAFSLGALRLYLTFAEKQTGGKRQTYLAAMLCFVLAMLAKPSAVAVPVTAWLLDYLILKRTLKQSIISILPWIVLSAPFIVIGKLIQPDIQVRFVPQLWQRFFVAGDALAFYLYKLVFPLSLGPDYGRTPEYVLGNWWGYATWIAPCLVALLAWTRRNKEPWFSAFCVMVASLLPILGFIPFVYQTYSTVADRYLYFPMLGFSLAIAWLALRLKSSFSQSILILALILLATLASFQQNFWRNTTSLFEHALSVNPRSFIARNNMAVIFISKGEINKAAEYLSDALEVCPEDAEANNNMGFILASQGKLDEAFEFYQRALKTKPNYSSVYVNLGNLYISKGDLQKAIECYQKAISFNPFDAAGYGNLGYALYRRGRVDEAIDAYRNAICLRPNFVEAHANLGDALMAQNKIEEAAEEYKEAIRLKPDFLRARIGLGTALNRLGKFDEAAENFAEAVKLDPESPEAHYGLGTALFRLKRYNEAITEFSEVIRLKPDFGGAHRNLAVPLFLTGRYAEAWREVRLARKYGAEPHPNFIKALTQKMPEP